MWFHGFLGEYSQNFDLLVFSMKLGSTGHVLKADTMVLGASDDSMSSTLGTTESDGF